MSKVLITSDIHLHDYRNYNLFGDPQFRLHQFAKLADRLCEIIEEEKVEAVCIAGDFLHVASPRPYIVNSAARFLAKLAARVPVYATHGQHDYDSRTDMSNENSLLSLYNFIPNVSYVHKTSQVIGGKSFYFQGWTESQDFSHVKPGEFDILIGHATITDSVINQYNTNIGHGQEYEHDKFKLCFMGDIHYHQVKGNQVIPGVPIQSNFGDAANTGVIILDTDDLSWKRVDTQNEKTQFLRFIVTDKKYDNPLWITKAPASSENASKKEKLHKSIDIMDVIEKSVVQADLLSIHDQALNSISKTDDEVNLNFVLESVHIENFRSIKLLDWTPSEGLTVINGKNGHGKTSLIQAVRVALNPPRSLSQYVRRGEKEMRVELVIHYEGVKHGVHVGCANGSGWIKYYQNDKLIETENQTATRDRIHQNLKFMKMWSLMSHIQGSPRFLSSYNYAGRVELVSKIIGLSITDRLKAAAEKLKTSLGLETTYKKLNSEVEAINMYLKSMENVDFSEADIDYQSKIDWAGRLRTDLIEMAKLDRNLQSVNSDLLANKAALDQYAGVDFSGVNQQTDEIENRIRDLRSKIAELQESVGSNDRLISTHRTQISALQQEMISNNSSISDLDSKLSKMSASKCYACDQETGLDIIHKMKHELTDKRNTLSGKNDSNAALIPNMLTQIAETMSSQDGIKNQITILNDELSVLQSNLRSIENLRTQNTRFMNAKAAMQSTIEKITAIRMDVGQMQIQIKGRFGIEITSPDDTLRHSNETIANLAELNQKLAGAQRLIAIKAEVNIKKDRLDNQIPGEIETVKKVIDDWDKYIVMMSPSGVVVRSVLTTVSEQLSNDKIQVVACKVLKSGETRPDFSIMMKVHDKWIDYDDLSGGQMIVCDIYLLNHLLSIAGGAGLLMFDETFGELDPDNLEYSIDLLKSVNSSKVFVVSHHEAFPYYDSQIIAKMKSGVTDYTFN